MAKSIVIGTSWRTVASPPERQSSNRFSISARSTTGSKRRGRRRFELFEEGESRPRQIALFPEDSPPAISDEEVVRVRLKDLELHHPRQWGACWLALSSLQPPGVGSFLGREHPRQPQGNALGPDLEDPGSLPVDRARERMEAAPALVRDDRNGGFVGRRLRHNLEVKLLSSDGELYVLAQSQARVQKERSMRRRKLKKLLGRLKELQKMKTLSRDELMLKLGGAKKEAGRAWHLVEIRLPAPSASGNPPSLFRTGHTTAMIAAMAKKVTTNAATETRRSNNFFIARPHGSGRLLVTGHRSRWVSTACFCQLFLLLRICPHGR